MVFTTAVIAAPPVLCKAVSMNPDLAASSDVLAYALQLFPQSPEELRARVVATQ